MRQNKKEVKKMKISEADLFEKIEAFLADYPICQYGFLKSEDILFSDKVRYICEKECPRYGKSWSCPPAVGEVADCKKHCISYQYALVFTTLSEVEDIDNMEETLATRPEHEEVVHAICQELEQLSEEEWLLWRDPPVSGQILKYAAGSLSFSNSYRCHHLLLCSLCDAFPKNTCPLLS